MEWFHANVGSQDAALQQRPIVLEAVGVNPPVNVLNGVIYNLVRVIPRQTLIRKQGIGVESRTCRNVLPNFLLQNAFATTGNNRGANLPVTLKDFHDGCFVFRSGAREAALAFADVHVSERMRDGEEAQAFESGVSGWKHFSAKWQGHKHFGQCQNSIMETIGRR